MTNNVLSDYIVFEDIVAAILEEESSRRNNEDRQVTSQQIEALMVTKGRSTKHGQNSKLNHGKSKSKSKKHLKCHFCSKKGHLKNECWNKKDFDPQGNVAIMSDDGMLYMVKQ